MRDVAGLQVPASSASRRAAVQSLRGGRAPRRFAATCRAVEGGVATVDFAGATKPAYLSPTTKAVQPGDRVQVEKAGGAWQVAQVDTWHDPVQVTDLPAGSYPTAQKPGQVSVPTTNASPPSSPAGSSNAQLYAWCVSADSSIYNMANLLNSLRSAVASIESRDRGALTNHANGIENVGQAHVLTRHAAVQLRAATVQDRVAR